MMEKAGNLWELASKIVGGKVGEVDEKNITK